MASIAHADIYEVTSKNFIFTGEVSEEEGRALINDLETYRSAVLTLLGGRGSIDEIRPVRIYGLDGNRDLRRFSGVSGISGAYAVTDEGPIYIMNVRGGVEEGDGARLTALHEYAHHITSRYTTKRYPRWYSEGFAEYLSTYYEDDGVINIGNPNVSSVSGVRNEQWISMNTVMGSIRSYPSVWGSLELYLFYGQSWLSVHYIMNDLEMSKQLNPYIEAINRGTEPIKAFETAFGITPVEFGKTLKAYLRAQKFPVMQFHRKQDFDAGDVTVRKFGDEEGETAMQLGRMAFASRNKILRRDVKKELEYQLKSDPNNADILAALAQISFFEKDINSAIGQANSVIDLDPAHKQAHYIYAESYFQAASLGQAGSVRKISDLKRSVDAFEAHLKLDPTHPGANVHYIDALLILADEQELTDLGNSALGNASARHEHIKKSVEFLVRYFPNSEHAIHRISALRALAMLGGQAQACELFEPIHINYRLGRTGRARADGQYKDMVRRCA